MELNHVGRDQTGSSQSGSRPSGNLPYQLLDQRFNFIMAMAGLHLKICAVIVTCATLSAVSLNSAFYASSTLWMRALLGLVGFIFGCLTLAYVWIFMQQPCPRQSLSAVTVHFLFAVVISLMGKSEISEVFTSCRNPMQHQRRLWQKILDLNGHTVYAKDNNLQGMPSLEEFRKQHPLSGYERFRPYVERTMEGEKSVVVDGFPDSYIRTTGTTGKPKYIPQKNKAKMFRRLGNMIGYVSNHHYPSNLMSKSLYFYVAPKVLKTKNGRDIETAATMSDKQDWFFALFSPPAAAFRITTMHEAFYVQLLFALMDPNLGRIIVGFLHFLESAMKLLEKEWKNITRDIEMGALNADLSLPPNIRKSLTNELQKYGSDPVRASELRREFQKGFVGIIRRIWPKMPVIVGIDSTGTWPKLSATYTKGLPLLSGFYGCSESLLGISLGPKYITRGYIPLVKWAVFEFIKEGEMSLAQPQTFFLDELEKGQNYEVVVTQPFGLYRYRMGDVIRVTDFYKDMPVIDFLYRTGQMLNIRYEKVDQRIVSDSIRAAAGRWTDRSVVEFAVAESTILTEKMAIYDPEEFMPYYIFFLEMKDPSKPLSNEDKRMIDAELRDRNSDVERLRGEGAISPPRVHVVRPGAFAKLEQYLLTNTGASANQYKVPRKLRTPAMVEVMIENIVS